MCQCDFGVGLTPRRGTETRITADTVPQDRQRRCQCSDQLLQIDCVWLVWCMWLSGDIYCVSSLNVVICPVERKTEAFHLKRFPRWKPFCRASGDIVVQYVVVFCLVFFSFQCEVGLIQSVLSCSRRGRVSFLRFAVRRRCRAVCWRICVCLCSLDSPLAQSVFIEQPPQIPTIAKLHRHRGNMLPNHVSVWQCRETALKWNTECFGVYFMILFGLLETDTTHQSWISFCRVYHSFSLQYTVDIKSVKWLVILTKDKVGRSRTNCIWM